MTGFLQAVTEKVRLAWRPLASVASTSKDQDCPLATVGVTVPVRMPVGGSKVSPSGSGPVDVQEKGALPPVAEKKPPAPAPASAVRSGSGVAVAIAGRA